MFFSLAMTDRTNEATGHGADSRTWLAARQVGFNAAALRPGWGGAQFHASDFPRSDSVRVVHIGRGRRVVTTQIPRHLPRRRSYRIRESLPAEGRSHQSRFDPGETLDRATNGRWTFLWSGRLLVRLCDRKAGVREPQKQDCQGKGAWPKNRPRERTHR
jgi:hypothetical protein